MSAGIARVLSIAGTDPTGGAGIHADLKSISANGGYGMAVVTALVAQNTRGVRALHVPPAPFLRQQLTAVSDDVVIDAVKIGMLANAETITTVTSWLLEVQPPVVVLDPVMIATSGDRLLDSDAGQALRALLPLADLVTPNVPELADLLETIPATTWEAVLGQARELARRHDVIVLAKGGHLDGADVRDALVDPDGTATEYVASRVATENTHGTGCSLSSAIATRRAAGDSWPEAVRHTTEWLGESLRRADELDVGRGHGPVHHFAGLWSRGGLDTAPTPDDVRSSWWSSISGTRTAIDDLAFIRQLGDGTLPTAAFKWYLAQDILYLREYARVLGRAGDLAPSSVERTFWARGAEEALTAEMALHERWVSPTDADGTLPSDATTAYLGHLADIATGGDYGELIAALLPCYWLYRDVGQRLHALSHDEHPFRDWLDTYADPSFAEATDLAIDIVTATAATATSATRARMLQAFQTSAEHELAFWRRPHLEDASRPPDLARESGSSCPDLATAELSDTIESMTKTPAATPAAAPDLAAATAMWSDYSQSRRHQDAVDSDYTVEHFGDTAKLADELLRIVLSGTKRATAELVSEFTHRGDPLPRIGSHWIACDGAGVPRIVIRSTQLRIDTFHGADAAFAYAEGEDDRTLDSWQIQHRLYWERTSAARGADWSELDEIVFEYFAVVWPPEHAD